MSFLFPSVWDDQDDFFDPFNTMSQFLGDFHTRRIQQQKAQQYQPRYYIFQTPVAREQPKMKEEEEEDGSLSDGEVIEEHQKREEEEEKMKEEEEEVEKAIAEAAERAEKDTVVVPPADVVETDTHFIITMDMPGLKKQDIIVSLDKDMLTVKAERPQLHTDAKFVLRREMPHGKIERQFEVPENTKPEAIYARVEDGILTITIKKPEVKPAAPAEAPRSISIA